MFAHGKNMPVTKIPKVGPPRIPRMVTAACARISIILPYFLDSLKIRNKLCQVFTEKMLPICFAINTKPNPMSPVITEIILQMIANFFSERLGRYFLTPSSTMVAAKEFTTLDTVL